MDSPSVSQHRDHGSTSLRPIIFGGTLKDSFYLHPRTIQHLVESDYVLELSSDDCNLYLNHWEVSLDEEPGLQSPLILLSLRTLSMLIAGRLASGSLAASD